ncbi:hypothetical protein P152DRAFT_185550 [Eremomyces bilateralis CBS 781.70]|uniref:Exosome complex component CSL4 C-terminal domain-containing protein n=1 Tax=Eremomyces bilateralis CBS 781.70 TaxID=1392243 RepID=A0A6G1GC14_9PEZI|nr:uncharacterized protein P152DRAFT_185550 [Eremomyces bilateralis CBS 781.70]KAF1815440.1 hypothetical protein P152DRAFT_185550 [Eremomyces bilateralis CBS 781.70]
MAQGILVAPGQVLGNPKTEKAGPNTHIQNGQICASVFGLADHNQAPTQDTNSTPVKTTAKTTDRATVSVTTTTSSINPISPTINSIVLARVTRLTLKQATVSILAISPSDSAASSSLAVCTTPFNGQIRLQDIRATEKDKVKMLQSFRVGDIVRAIVISLGDQAAYYLSTARNDLGVVMAWADDGEQLVPVSWKEMEGMTTGKREDRKVAKPI